MIKRFTLLLLLILPVVARAQTPITPSWTRQATQISILDTIGMSYSGQITKQYFGGTAWTRQYMVNKVDTNTFSATRYWAEHQPHIWYADQILHGVLSIPDFNKGVTFGNNSIVRTSDQLSINLGDRNGLAITYFGKTIARFSDTGHFADQGYIKFETGLSVPNAFNPSFYADGSYDIAIKLNSAAGPDDGKISTVPFDTFATSANTYTKTETDDIAALKQNAFTLTNNSVPFWSGSNLTQDNVNFRYDSSKKRLTIGDDNSPGYDYFDRKLRVYDQQGDISNTYGFNLNINSYVNWTPTTTQTGKIYSGIHSFLEKDGSASAGILEGFGAVITANSTATTQELRGFSSYIQNINTGLVTSATHYLAISPVLSGGATIGTVYGLRVAKQKVSGVTTGYGVYQDDAADINIFNGATQTANLIPITTNASTIGDATHLYASIFGTTGLFGTIKTNGAGLTFQSNTASNWGKIAESTGNWTIGGTTDAGFKADVQGSLRVSGNATFNSALIVGSSGTGSALSLNNARTTSALGSTGYGLDAAGVTYTDNSSAAASTVAQMNAVSFKAPTFAFINAVSALTDAYNVHIYGAPTSAIAANKWALSVDAGNSKFDGNLFINGSGSTAITQSAGDNSAKIATTAFVQTAMQDVVNTATDANYTITSANQLVKLPVVTANRTVSIPTASSYTGRILRIWNQNTSGTFSWSFTGATVKDAANNTLTNLVNTSVYVLESDGNNWLKIN